MSKFFNPHIFHSWEIFRQTLCNKNFPGFCSVFTQLSSKIHFLTKYIS